MVKSDLKSILDELDSPPNKEKDKEKVVVQDQKSTQKSENATEIKIGAPVNNKFTVTTEADSYISFKSSIEHVETGQRADLNTSSTELGNIARDGAASTPLSNTIPTEKCITDEDEFNAVDQPPAVQLLAANGSITVTSNDDLEIDSDSELNLLTEGKKPKVADANVLKNNPAKSAASDNKLWSLRLDYNDSVVPVSASTGAGINQLWKNLMECAQHSVRMRTLSGDPIPSNAVKEHVLSMTLRRKTAAASSSSSGGKRR